MSLPNTGTAGETIIFSMDESRKVHKNPVNGVYLHGQLENIIGFDIPSSCNFDLSKLPKDTYDCLVCSPEVKHPISSVLFLWHDQGYNRTRGLIVDSNDEKSLKYAFSKYKEEAVFI